MMGINEKKYAWMDEGIASFVWPFLHLNSEIKLDQSYMASQSIAPIMVPSHIMQNSAINSYTVSYYSYVSLYQLLGKDLFNKCLKTYMDTWKYKHPTPYDFMFIFNKVSGRDINWFWKQWYFDWGYMDIGIKGLKENVLIVENLGGRPMPFTIKVNYTDETSSLEEVNPVVWKDKSTYSKKIETKKEITSIEIKILDNGDAVENNNMFMIK
jgi:aminopeptidase N